MKKQYIQPSLKSINISSTTILAGSNVTYGGSNREAGPIAAEAKGRGTWYDYDDDDF